MFNIPESTQKFIQFVLIMAAGSGGLMYWIDRWRERVRLSARLLRLDSLFFKFEVENHGKSSASLTHQVQVVGYRVENGKVTRKRYFYDVMTPDRSLPSHVPKQFSASYDGSNRSNGNELELIFPRYRFAPTWGIAASVYGEEHSHMFSIRRGDRLPHISAYSYWRAVFKLRVRLSIAGRKSPANSR